MDEVASDKIDSTADFTQTKYLLYGLDLEEQQCVFPVWYFAMELIGMFRRKLQIELMSTKSEPLPTAVVELRTLFRRRLVKFRELQAKYQPETVSLLARLPSTGQDPDSVHETPLLLPSSLPPEALSKCSARLLSMEKRLRIGQCRDSLAQLRTKLTAQARLLKHKFVHVRNQAPNTRSRNLLNRNSTKIAAIAAKYRHAFSMLCILDPGGSEWSSEFKELGKQDVRCFAEAELPNAPTQERMEELHARTLLNGGVEPEGNRTVSWIWRGSLKDGSEHLGEGMSLPF